MTKRVVIGKHGREIVEDSCGCVLCDLNLPVLQDRSGKYHETYKHPGQYRVPCTKQS